jgi:predicted O-methyltransferase YrrM
MNQELWARVDDYITDVLVPSDAALDGALQRAAAAGLPAINVAPNQGKLLQLLAQIQGAKRILEVGTLGGYSTIWLARALPEDGQLVTLEIDPHHAEVARESIVAAGLADRVDVRVGPALDTLADLEGPFDFSFIDADKEHNADYFMEALRLSQPGSVIVVDNVIRAGAVLDGSGDDPAVQGTRRLNELMAAELRVSVTEVQTVGSKGHDGFALALVR